MPADSLSPRLRRTAKAAAEAIFASEEGPPPARRVEHLIDALEAFLGDTGPGTRRLYRLILWVLGLIAPLFVFRLPGLSRLRLPLRIRALERLERSPFGAVILGLKVILCTAYWEEAEAAKEIGFDARCLLPAPEARPTPAPIGGAPEG